MCCIITVYCKIHVTVNLGAFTYRAVCHRPDLSCLWKLMGDSCTIIHPLPTKNFRSVASVNKWCWFQNYTYCINLYAKYCHTVCSGQVKLCALLQFCSAWKFVQIQKLRKQLWSQLTTDSTARGQVENISTNITYTVFQECLSDQIGIPGMFSLSNE